MPRYDDHYGGTRLYVGHLSSRVRSRDLEVLFSRYGRVRDVDMKHDFAFVEFSDPRDADDARYNLDGRDVSGSRIIVEFAKGGPRGRGSSHEYLGRGPSPGSGRCFNCGLDGHWARDCKAGDWKNKCYRCGERGHIERNCTNSPKNLRRGRSYSRSPSPRRGRYSRSRSPRRGGHRISPPYKRRERSLSPDERPRRRERSLTPDGSRSPVVERDISPSPKGAAGSEQDGSDYDKSPRRRENSRSPRSQDEQGSPAARGNSSSPKANGRSPSPVKDDDGYASRGGSQSP